jgi:hypothetical protein
MTTQNPRVLPPGTTSSGLKVAFDFVANTATVTAGFYQLPPTMEWVLNAGIGNRWDVPVDVTLPIPTPGDPNIPCPYLCLAYDDQTKTAGIYFAHLGDFSAPLHNVEFLACWQWVEKTWLVRQLGDDDGNWHFGS